MHADVLYMYFLLSITFQLPPSLNAAQVALRVLHHFIITKGNSEKVLLSLNNVEDFVTDEMLKGLHQAKITDYFTPSQGMDVESQQEGLSVDIL
jgi:hypothetical protein